MILQGVEQTFSKNNGKPYNKLTIDGKFYNWFKDLGDLKIGDNVTCTFSQNGQYTNLETIEKMQLGAPIEQIPQTDSKHEIVITRTEKPHSYEFGPANQRHKIYYSEVAELRQHIEELESAFLTVPVEKPGQ